MDLKFNARGIALYQGFQILKKDEDIFHINDGSGAFVTLVRGEKMALLVDTSWGIKDLRSLVESLISTPYKVVNTHGHPDHCWGNFQFDEVFVPEKDVDVFYKMKNYTENRDALFKTDEEREAAKPREFPPLKTVREGEVFDLGGITVQVVPLYGHTHGSLGYLLKEKKILISGDSVTVSPWLFMKETLPLSECKKTYEETKKFDFEKILGSHSKVLWPKTLLDSLIDVIDGVISGRIDLSEESVDEIMGYRTVSVFGEKEPGCWITINADTWKR